MTKKRPHPYARMQGPTEDVMDKTPVAMPIGWDKPDPLHEQIARLVREAVQAETGEEVGDFDEEDDFVEEDEDLLDFSAYEFPEIQEDYLEPPPEVALPQAAQEEQPKEPDPGVVDPEKEPEA